jgi:putative cell wall-binding protein
MRINRAVLSCFIFLVVIALAGTAFATVEPYERIYGSNRYATSAVTATALYLESDAVIIVRGDDQGQFADGLAASVLAGALDIPILLTRQSSVPAVVKEAIVTLGAEKAYILGGTVAVANSVEQELVGLGLEVERISGENRAATAAAVAQRAASSTTAFVVNGHATADAMLAGPVAFRDGAPILMVNRNSIPLVTKNAIAELEIDHIFVVGGSGVVSDSVANELSALPGVSLERLGGLSRFETSILVATAFFPGTEHFGVVGGYSLPDAVGACIYGIPILYVRQDSIPAAVRKYFDENADENSFATIFGGPAAVSEMVAKILLLPGEINEWIENSRNVFLAQSREYNGNQYLLVTYGMRPTTGFEVNILDVDIGTDSVEVLVDFVRPGPSAPLIITRPFDLLIMPDTGLPVHFTPTGDEFHIMELVGIDELQIIVAQSFWIKVFDPAPGDTVSDVFAVEGIASTFEGNVLYRLLDINSNVLDSGFTTAAMGDWGYFSETLTVPNTVQSGAAMTLQLYTESAKDGSIQDLVIVQLKLE